MVFCFGDGVKIGVFVVVLFCDGVVVFRLSWFKVLYMVDWKVLGWCLF